jgi:hypothetical protein
MIDSKFMISYTNALYSTEPEFAPRYDEFRDMFSSGQLLSKEWLVNEFINLDMNISDKSFVIAGAWYGTLGLMLWNAAPYIDITLLDIDPRCKKYVDNIIHGYRRLKYVTEDMYKHHYKEDFIINTSCEHILDLREWLNIIPMGKIVVLQSNNYIDGIGHINCVFSKEAFVKQSGLTNILYSGELVMPMYARYMIIGIT